MKLVALLLWQLSQVAVPLGICGGVFCPCAPVVPSLVKAPLWQELQAMPLTAEWLIV